MKIEEQIEVLKGTVKMIEDLEGKSARLEGKVNRLEAELLVVKDERDMYHESHHAAIDLRDCKAASACCPPPKGLTWKEAIAAAEKSLEMTLNDVDEWEQNGYGAELS